MFAGKEVARALAIMSLKAEDCTDNLEGVTEKQMGTLKEWEDKFRVKYPVVGEVPPPLPSSPASVPLQKSVLWCI